MTPHKALVGTLSALALLMLVQADAHAGFGAGVMVGDIEGVTAEFALKGRGKGRGLGQAFEATVTRDTYAHVVLKLYLKTLVRNKMFSVPLYVGVGAFMNGDGRSGPVKVGTADKGGKDGGKGKGKGKKLALAGSFDLSNRGYGARVPVGVALEFRRLPAHVFVEVSAQIAAEDREIQTITGAGFRYFF